MKKLIATCLCILPLGCTSLMDAAALLASLKDKSGLIENWHATVLPEDDPGSFVQTKSVSESHMEFLGFEVLMVELPGEAVYPVICPADMTSRCRQMIPGTKVFINSGNVVPCSILRDGKFHEKCIAATELRQEM